MNHTISESKRSKWCRSFALISAWAVSVLLGFGGLQKYAMTPGEVVAAPLLWPAESVISNTRVPTDPRPTLVMFVHPQCPCTRASMSELAELLARTRQRLHVYVMFLKPSGVGEDWVRTDLWSKAKQVPQQDNVRVLEDDDGRESERFGATTSGHVVLYDAKDRLLFSGGITLSRGHAGGNPGRRAIESFLNNETSTQVSAPVYGCPLDHRRRDASGSQSSCCDLASRSQDLQEEDDRDEAFTAEHQRQAPRTVEQKRAEDVR